MKTNPATASSSGSAQAEPTSSNLRKRLRDGRKYGTAGGLPLLRLYEPPAQDTHAARFEILKASWIQKLFAESFFYKRIGFGHKVEEKQLNSSLQFINTCVVKALCGNLLAAKMVCIDEQASNQHMIIVLGHGIRPRLPSIDD
jgi:hypothetical protein